MRQSDGLVVPKVMPPDESERVNARTASSEHFSRTDTPEYRHVEYRPDVDGLRAVGVLSVVAFHAVPGWVHGGFVGVDVFFVISGYLICGIIFRSLAAGGFSFREFYARRIRRIFPALVLVLAATLAVGWVTLLASEYTLLGINAAGGAGFISNLLLWHQSGYFEPDSHSNPLLHLWSLGIEEQFYIVWPLILYAAWRWRLNLILPSLVVLVASLGICLILTPTNPVAAFYSPASRFWELQIGGVLAYVAPQIVGPWREAAGWGGALMILTAVFGLDQHGTFPGFAALLPTAGAALTIAAGPRAFVNRRILSHPMVVWVGLISYPLYLWHWPLLSFAGVMDAGATPATVRALLVAISVLLAWATYRWVERPIRYGASATGRVSRSIPVGHGLGALVGAMAAAGLMGFVIARSDGLGFRSIAMQHAKIDAAIADWTFPGVKVDGKRILPVVNEGTTTKKVVFLGDSHMEQYWPRVSFLYETGKPRLGSIFATFNGCPPFLDSHRWGSDHYWNCDEVERVAMAFARGPDAVKVVFGASWAFYNNQSVPSLAARMDELLEGFGRSIANFTGEGKDVYVLLQSALGDEMDPHALLGNRWRILLASAGPAANQSVNRQEKSREYEMLMQKLSRVAKRSGAKVIDPMDYFCTATSCPTMIDGEPTYMDGAHLRASVVRQQATFIDEILLDHDSR